MTRSPASRLLHAAALAAALALAGVSATGCRTIYYNTMETFGQEKRDILVKRGGKAERQLRRRGGLANGIRRKKKQGGSRQGRESADGFERIKRRALDRRRARLLHVSRNRQGQDLAGRLRRRAVLGGGSAQT